MYKSPDLVLSACPLQCWLLSFLNQSCFISTVVMNEGLSEGLYAKVATERPCTIAQLLACNQATPFVGHVAKAIALLFLVIQAIHTADLLCLINY